MKKLLYENEVLQKLDVTSEVVIYGAGVMGKAVKKCLTEKPYDLMVRCFLVQSRDNNPESIDGIPVLTIDSANEYKEDLILIALHEKHIKSAIEALKNEGFSNLLPLSFDSDAWSDLRGNWFAEYFNKQGECYLDLHEELRVQQANFLKESLADKMNIYVVHSAADRVLKEDVALQKYETPIQVGAALTDKKLFAVRDDSGIHISEKNRKYCELTALYWIWKNSTDEYLGISHYRRKFDLDENQIKKLVVSDIDVVLTVPVLNFPSVRQQYCNDHEERDWDVMLEAIQVLCPEYLKTAKTIQDGIYYYAYNMFITRKGIFDCYCEWLFEIVDYCEKKIGEKNDKYQNRYIGFLAERLLTIFFVHHKEDYKIAIARKHFIETVD